MPLPLIAGIGAIVGKTLFGIGQKIAKFALIATFLVALGVAFYKFSRMYFEIYSKIQGAVDGIGTTYGGLLGCVISALGIDDFLTSGLAIFTTASIFWGISVAYIASFKMTKTAYKYMVKGVS
jgi:hypothetical protein